MVDIDIDTKSPKLLPRKQQFSRLIIMEIHCFTYLCNEFWIPRGWAEIRKVLSQCVVCKKNTVALLFDCHLGLEKKYQDHSLFNSLGLIILDLLISGKVNWWGKCGYVCLHAYKYVLFLVKGLSAQMFLDCFQRFISHRGRPRSIICDNAPQFRLVKSTLDWQWTKLFKSDELRGFLSCESIKWSFTRALSLWQGGFYKRLIGMVKQSLRKGMGCKVLYWDKLLTLLVEVEAIINSRPLTYVGEDFESGFVLTLTLSYW